MLNEIPEFFHPEIRQLIDFTLEDAWHELRNDGLADTASVRGRLATTIVALAAIGETDPIKLKKFALHATAKGVTELQVYRLGGNGFGQMATPHNIEF